MENKFIHISVWNSEVRDPGEDLGVDVSMVSKRIFQTERIISERISLGFRID